MSVERLFLLDPYNNKHKEMILSFEKENSLTDKPSITIDKIINSIDKETYYNNKKENNEINEILFMEKENSITDCCYINGEKDIKTCKIIPLNINNKNKKRRLLLLAANYALNTLGLEEVFIDVKEEDNNNINYLTQNGFENLGADNGKIIFLKEREEKENTQRMIS